MNKKLDKFKQTLDDHHTWPCPYIFKFIVPTENLHLVTSLFRDTDVKTRESKTGKYTSVTVESTMCSSQKVMEVYEKVSQVPGVMSL